jgi:hypothetical protein
MAIEFPRIPSDPKSIELISNMNDFAVFMLMGSNESTRVKKVAGIFHTLATNIYDNDYIYFRIYQAICGDYQNLTDWYNYKIWAEGEEFMLETLEREAEDFLPLLMPFQITMRMFVDKAKSDKSWEPLSSIWWTIWTCMYDSKKMGKVIDDFERVINDIDDDLDQQRKAMLN